MAKATAIGVRRSTPNRRAPRLSLDLLRGFHAAARHLSFTRAAQELFLTQSAVSHEIRTLEEQLGRPLFRRVNRTLELTPVGQELFNASDETLGKLDAVIERISGSASMLTVTTTPALACSGWLRDCHALIGRIRGSMCEL